MRIRLVMSREGADSLQLFSGKDTECIKCLQSKAIDVNGWIAKHCSTATFETGPVISAGASTSVAEVEFVLRRGF